nr:hypothetical protein Cry52Nrm3_p162 [Cryptomonas curvata]
MKINIDYKFSLAKLKLPLYHIYMLIEWVSRKIILPNLHYKSKIEENQSKYIYYKKKKNFINLKSKNKHRNRLVYFIVKMKSSLIAKKYKKCQHNESIKNLTLLYTKGFNYYRYCNAGTWIKKLKCQSNIFQTDLNKRLFFYIKTKRFNLKTIDENAYNVNLKFFCQEKQCKFFFVNINRKLIINIVESLVLKTFEEKKKFRYNFLYKNKCHFIKKIDTFFKSKVRHRILLKILKNKYQLNQNCCLINKRFWFTKKTTYFKYKIK